MILKLFLCLIFLLTNVSLVALFAAKQLENSENSILNSAPSNSEVSEKSWPSAVKIVDLDDLEELLNENRVDSKPKSIPSTSWSRFLDFFGISHNEVSEIADDFNDKGVAIFAIPDWNEAHLNNNDLNNRVFQGIFIPPQIKNISNVYISKFKLMNQIPSILTNKLTSTFSNSTNLTSFNDSLQGLLKVETIDRSKQDNLSTEINFLTKDQFENTSFDLTSTPLNIDIEKTTENIDLEDRDLENDDIANSNSNNLEVNNLNFTETMLKNILNKTQSFTKFKLYNESNWEIGSLKTDSNESLIDSIFIAPQTDSSIKFESKELEDLESETIDDKNSSLTQEKNLNLTNFKNFQNLFSSSNAKFESTQAIAKREETSPEIEIQAMVSPNTKSEHLELFGRFFSKKNYHTTFFNKRNNHD